MSMQMSIMLIILGIIVIICYIVAISYIFEGIGQTDDISNFSNPGYMVSAVLFALVTAGLAAYTVPDSEIILPISVIVGVTALALVTGALATGSISH
jgi:hypothetical protein